MLKLPKQLYVRIVKVHFIGSAKTLTILNKLPRATCCSLLILNRRFLLNVTV